jgi:hypothetical protein
VFSGLSRLRSNLLLVFLLQGFCDIACGIDSKAEEPKSDVIISIQGFS